MVLTGQPNTLPTQEGKEFFWLPFRVNCNEDYIEALSHRLDEYREFYKDCNFDNIKVINSLCECIPKIIKEYVNGNTLKAWKLFSVLMNRTLLKEIEGNKDLWVRDIGKETQSYYRTRKGIFTDSNDLKHIPFDKLYLTKSDRYTSQGSISLYLSNTKEASHVEIGIEGTTTAQFTLLPDKELKVFDMCAFRLNSQQNKSNTRHNDNKSVLSLWPLIVACNSIAYCCPIEKTECKSISRNFKIEYVIPQMLASYIKEKFSSTDNKIRGIRYYTVRNEMLDSSSLDWMDLVLFTEYDSIGKYDNFLKDAFIVSIL